MPPKRQLAIPIILAVLLFGIGGVVGLNEMKNPTNDDSQVSPPLVQSPTSSNIEKLDVSESQPRVGRTDVTINNQVSEGKSIIISSVTLPEGGVVVIQSTVNGQPQELRGLSSGIPPGTSNDITITLDKPLQEDQQVIAIAESEDEEARDLASITIRQRPPPVRGPDPPTDPDGDGLFEDVNGDGQPDFDDVEILFEEMNSSPVQESKTAYDFNQNGRIDFADIIKLSETI